MNHLFQNTKPSTSKQVPKTPTLFKTLAFRKGMYSQMYSYIAGAAAPRPCASSTPVTAMSQIPLLQNPTIPDYIENI